MQRVASNFEISGGYVVGFEWLIGCVVKLDENFLGLDPGLKVTGWGVVDLNEVI